jgi:hypothetical protein
MPVKSRNKRDAEYYFQNIDTEIRDSLTTKQEWEVKKALNNALGRPSQKIVDIRFTIPLLFSRFFFVLFIGRDIRRQKRMHDLTGEVRTANAIFGAFILACMISFSAVTIFMLLYLAKCAFGINIFPDFSLSKHLKQIFFS